MRCSEVQNTADEYLDGELPAEVACKLKQHVSACAACQDELEMRQAIRSGLSQLPVEGPGEGFFDGVFDRVDEQTHRETLLRRSDQTWLRSKGRRWAIAAGFAFVCVTALVLQNSFRGTPSSEIPEVTLAMHEVTSVNLVFSAEDALQNARLSLQLPEGVELAGYSGRSALSWNTDLQPGKNVLRLPLVGHLASADEVVATLEHRQGTKTFRLKVKVI